MNAKEKARHESLARILKSLAHPVRLYLVTALEKGERTVGELTGMVDADVSTVSKHLSMMRAAGVLEQRKDGLRVYYRRRTDAVAGLFASVDAIAAGAGKAKRPVEAKAARPAKASKPVKPAKPAKAVKPAKRAAKPAAKSSAKRPAARRR